MSLFFFPVIPLAIPIIIQGLYDSQIHPVLCVTETSYDENFDKIYMYNETRAFAERFSEYKIIDSSEWVSHNPDTPIPPKTHARLVHKIPFEYATFTVSVDNCMEIPKMSLTCRNEYENIINMTRSQTYKNDDILPMLTELDCLTDDHLILDENFTQKQTLDYFVTKENTLVPNMDFITKCKESGESLVKYFQKRDYDVDKYMASCMSNQSNEIDRDLPYQEHIDYSIVYQCSLSNSFLDEDFALNLQNCIINKIKNPNY